MPQDGLSLAARCLGAWGTEFFKSPFVIEKGAKKKKSHILTLPQNMYVQLYKFIKHKAKTAIFGLINPTHYQGRKGNVNNELNLQKFSM